MLSDLEFIIQSLTLNIFYLTNIRGFSLNITLSFLNRECIDTAKEYIIKSEKILNMFVDKINDFLPENAIKGNFLVSEYTLPCEILTENLFNIKLDKAITNKLLLLKKHHLEEEPKEMVTLMTSVNKETYELAVKYIDFLKSILNDIKTNKLFSYSSPFVIRTMIKAIEFYNEMMLRNIKKVRASPTSVSNYEYRVIELMRNIATYMSLIVNPERNDVYIKFNSFSVEFSHLRDSYLNVDLTPKTMIELTKKTQKSIFRYSNYFKEIIKELLDNKVYFIVEPIFIDDFYRAANYIIYNLNIIETSIMKEH
ncbi:MAG: hypothetical protein PHF21_03140 [Bacilli bacterium]|nr:hypothetical protein [Bacilli bacterium]